MPLFVSEKDLVQGSAAVGLLSGDMKTLFVYGNEANMMVATRSPGYHSKPHKHIPEQLNYVVEGELWIFIVDKAYHLKKGDFLRIGAVHDGASARARACAGVKGGHLRLVRRR